MAGAQLWLPLRAESAARARRFVSEYCRATGMDAEDCHTVSLLVSELVTNALVHGGSAAAVEVQRRDDVIRVTVRDANGSRLPQLRTPGPQEEGGRGLRLVSALTDRWGVGSDGDGVGDGDGDGKVVWFALTLGGGPRRSVPSPRER